MKISGVQTHFIKCLILAFVALTFMLGMASPSYAKDKQRRDIRFYKANKILQTDRIRFTRKKGAKLGCHNFVKKARVFKIVQFGYAACHIYSKTDCAPDSIVEIAREKDEITSATLLEGYGWYPYSDNKRGVKLKSWSCSSEAPAPSSFVGTEIESRKAAEERVKKAADEKAMKKAKEKYEKDAEKRAKNKAKRKPEKDAKHQIEEELEEPQDI